MRAIHVPVCLPVWFVLLVISRDIVLIGGALFIKLFPGSVPVLARFSTASKGAGRSIRYRLTGTARIHRPVVR